jgi:hypothetical protein
VRSFSAVSEWVRMVNGSFLECAISELLTHLGFVGYEKVTRPNDAAE